MRLTLALILLAQPLLAADTKARADYILVCSGCHGMTGQGTEIGGVPAFPASVGRIAASERGRTYMMHVPGVVSNALDNAEIAAVTNYVLNEWGDGAAPFTEGEVTRRRAIPIKDVVAERRGLAQELAGAGVNIAPYPWP